jgi:hypothetical protein
MGDFFGTKVHVGMEFGKWKDFKIPSNIIFDVF